MAVLKTGLGRGLRSRRALSLRVPDVLALDRRAIGRATASGQAAAYVITGLWPIVDLRSFERVTGPKRDDWLVRTVGGLAVAFGGGLAWRSHDPASARPFGVASAAAFLAADVIGIASGRLPRIYLLDAAGEAVVLAGWAASVAWPRRRVAPRPVAVMPVRPERGSDVVSLRREVEDRHADAQRSAALAWPTGGAPDAVTEALHRLGETREELHFAVEGGDTERVRALVAAATEDAAAIHEAADLISS
jgi:hypothetical protein